VIEARLLDDREVQLVQRCLEAVASGRFFPQWEFETLFGLSQKEVQAIAGRWPHNAAERSTETAVINAVAHLYGYPHGQEDEIRNAVGAEPASLGRLLEKLRSISKP